MNTPRTHSMRAHLHRTGHWCNMHLLHDAHFWLYVLLAVAVTGFITLMVFVAKNAPMVDDMFTYPGYPYGGVR